MLELYSKTPDDVHFIPAFEEFMACGRWLCAPEASDMDHAELEDEVERRGREVMRLLYQGHLDRRAAAEERTHSVLGSDGVRRSHRKGSARPLALRFGDVRVPRVQYAKPGVPSLFPADACLNLPADLYSFGLRRLVAEQTASSSYDDTVELLERTAGRPVPKRQVEQLAERAAVDFESFYEQRQGEAPNAGDIVVLTTDGKGVLVRKEDLRPQTLRKAQRDADKSIARLSKGEKRNRKRMATVASVYSVAPNPRTPEDVMPVFASKLRSKRSRPKPTNKRAWASLEREPEEVIHEMFDEALKRDPERQHTWVVLVDGAWYQEKLIRRLAAERKLSFHIVLDFVHVLEYLWKAAWCFFDEKDPKAHQWVAHRARELLRGRVSHVVAGIRRRATRCGLRGNRRKQVDKTCNYMSKRKELMEYGLALREGWPIATGVIEGACRYLIKDRMDVTGARWSLKGAEVVLQLRAIRTSGDFDDYWNFHKRAERRRNHLGKLPQLRAA